MNVGMIGFAGGIKSGKTAVSDQVSERLRCPRVSFGDYVRKMARERGDAATRQSWQTLGESLVQQDVLQFCNNVLAQGNWAPGQPIVIEGIRHVSALEVLRHLAAPFRFVFIYIDADGTVRNDRYRAENPDGPSLQILDEHSTEAEVQSLRQRADLIVKGTRSVDDAVKEIMQWLA